MNLKLLLFPTLLFLAVFLIIVYIKPDIETILTKRDEETSKQETLRKVEVVEGNIRSLAQSLNQKNDVESLVNRYLPQSIDQERSLDIVNFLAQQTGVAVNKIDMKENQQVQQTVVVTSETGETDPNQGGTLLERGPESPRSYGVTVDVMGNYQNLRTFFERLYHTDRMRAVNVFTLRQPEQMERFRGEQEIIPADFLLATISMDFFYAPSVGAGNALTQSIFQKDRIDFSAANQLVDFINSPVGDLAPASPGRSNPFEAIP